MQDKEELHDFNDVEPRELRAYNRGAVLANIHGKYVQGDTIHGSVMSGWLAELNDYLVRIPSGEVQEAKDAMKVHLEKRGED